MVKPINQAPPQDGAYCGYLRRSQQDAEYEKYGEFEVLERHKRIITRASGEYGHELKSIFREVASGETIADREVFRSLLTEVAQGKWDGVYVVEASRLGRPSGSDIDKIINAFRYSGTWIITESKIYNPSMKADMRQLRRDLQIASEERDDSIDRLYRGRRESAMEGNYVCSQAAFGWQRVNLGKRQWTLEPHPVNYDRMLAIYDMLDDDMSLSAVAKEAMRRGWKTTRGKDEWNANTVKVIAQNVLNIGYIVFERTTTELVMNPKTLDPEPRKVRHDKYIQVEGKHKRHCTLDEEKFWRVQRKIEARSPYSPLANGLKNPLAGLLVCAKCGTAMNYHRVTTPLNRDGYVLYMHSEAAVRKRGCNCKSIRYDDLMAALYEVLGAMMEDRRLDLTDDGRRARRERHLAQIASVERELESLMVEKKRVMEGYRKGLYTDDEFEGEKADVTNRISAMEECLGQLRDALPDDVRIEREIVSIGKCLDVLRMEATPQEANDALKQFIRRIEYRNDAPKGVRWNKVTLDVFFA